MPASHFSRWLAVIVVLAAALPSSALDPNRLVTQYVRRSWSVRQGLPQDSIQALAQTPDGYLWIGTTEGLARHDGVRFEVFNSSNTPQLKSNNILALYTDRSGALWVGTAHGVTVLRNGAFEYVQATDGLRGVFGIERDENSGTMWFGASTGGVQRYEKGRLTPYPHGPSAIYKLYRANGVLWIGAADGLYRLQGSEITRADFPQIPVVSLLTQGDSLWVGTVTQGLLCFRDGHMVSPNPIPIFEGQEIWALLLDRNGNFWIGARSGLWRRTPDQRMSKIGTAEGLSHDFIDSLYEDDEGSLWVGTHVAGLNQLRDGFVLSYTKLEGLADSPVWSVTQDRQGTVWAGTEHGGLYRMRDERWTNIAAAAGLGKSQIPAVTRAQSGNGVWVGTYGEGVRLIEGDRVVKRLTDKDGLPSPFITSLVVDRHGSLWIGTMAGLAREVDGHFVVYGTKEGLPSPILTILGEDADGGIWIAAGAAGPVVFDGRQFRHTFRGRNLPPEAATAMASSAGGDVWLGMRSRLVRIGRSKTFTYTPAHGLPPGGMLQIVDDGTAVWVAAPTGLYRLSRRELDAVMNGVARTLSPAFHGADDGMPGETANGVMPSTWRTDDGRIWFATFNGLAVIDPRAAAAPARLRPIVEAIRVNRRPFPPRQGVVMNDARDRLELQYTAPSSLAPDRLRFRYRLVGFDRDWIDAADRRFAEYTNLPPGDYEFRVAASADGKSWTVSSMPARVQRLPAIYETGWFLAVCAALAGASIWLVHHRRMRALRLRHEAIVDERKRIALEFHDTLAQGLSATIMRIDSAMESPTSERAAEHLQIGKELVRTTLADAHRALVNLRSASLERADLAEALRTMVESSTKGMPVSGSVDVVGTRRRLRDVEVENHLLRIGQEAITNALRHSNAKSVRVLVEYRPKAVVLQVRDDGDGPPGDAGEPGGNGHGMLGMRERAERIGATLTARRHPQGGFEIAVEVAA